MQIAGDILIQINRRKIHEMSLEKVLAILQKEPGEKIKLTVKRENHLRKFTFRLQSFFFLAKLVMQLKIEIQGLKSAVLAC